MTSLGIVPGINFFVSGHFLILFIDLTNLPEALCVQKICRGIIHFDPTIVTNYCAGLIKWVTHQKLNTHMQEANNLLSTRIIKKQS